MSRYLNQQLANLSPYTPGEQPQQKGLVKLNTNESPYAPSSKVLQAIEWEAAHLNLYPDPTCRVVIEPLAETFSVKPENVIVGNGSDELLGFLFQGFCSQGAAFADLTYGFYPVFANLYGVQTESIPLRPDFSIDPEDYAHIDKTVFIANPNAPTGLALKLVEIETILLSNPNNLVIIDEAYVDFGAESAIPLLDTYDNLVVVGTFSKSRSLAGARLGYAVANESIIADLQRIRLSFNPYNVNRTTLAAGAAALEDASHYAEKQRKIMETRSNSTRALQSMGFICTNSMANFIFAAHPAHKAEVLYKGLRERGILVRWFDTPRAKDHLRITVGSVEQMECLQAALQNIISG